MTEKFNSSDKMIAGRRHFVIIESGIARCTPRISCIVGVAGHPLSDATTQENSDGSLGRIANWTGNLPDALLEPAGMNASATLY